MPRSRWVSACGLMDLVSNISSRCVSPVDERGRILGVAGVDHVGVAVSDQAPGFRTREVTLVTTLLDAEAYPADELAELYGTRWR